MKQELKDNAGDVFFSIEYLEDKKLMYANWIGSYLTVEQVKEGGLLALSLIKECKAQYILNDNRQLDGGLG